MKSWVFFMDTFKGNLPSIKTVNLEKIGKKNQFFENRTHVRVIGQGCGIIEKQWEFLKGGRLAPD
ncbi:hypothetical protein [Sporosarcina globispora]|uniref:hypothetical protein n=1 Tax=Sporosarcina globispora TaxID=1459 RepID=UPI000ABED26B|nr:hypothetical protein [Sporosarcina globispora]